MAFPLEPSDPGRYMLGPHAAPEPPIDPTAEPILSSEDEELAAEQHRREELFLQQVRDRFRMTCEAEVRLREEYLEDLRFRIGEQWDPQIKNQRHLDGRPCLTINRVLQFLRQVTNEQRQNRPSIRVSPVNDVADKETARVIQGLIRHIERNSNADTAYDTAFEYAATMGIGYFRVLKRYVDDGSFEQELQVQRILDPMTVHVDPFVQEADYSDMRWAFIVEDMPIDEFKSSYP